MNTVVAVLIPILLGSVYIFAMADIAKKGNSK